MIALGPEDLAWALGTPTAVGTHVTGVSIDTRSLRPGDLFVAVRGDRHDGHDYVQEAFAAGACGAVVQRHWWEKERLTGETEFNSQVESVVYPVDDTLVTLGRLATAVRRKARAVVIAITGSVGKTGTKDLLKVMASKGGSVVATTANQNNEIGVPLTLLSITEETMVVVVEMGMRGKGQIAYLCEIAEPDVGIITNIYPAHLELLGSIEDIAEAKAELLAGVRPAGTVVVPAFCRSLAPYAGASGRRVVRFALAAEGQAYTADTENARAAAPEAEVWGEVGPRATGQGGELCLYWPGGSARIRTSFEARYRMENAVAAAAGCYAAGLPLARCLPALEEAVFTPGRGDREQIGPWFVIDETYNANPAAVKAALNELARIASETGGRPVAVLGDMLELGAEGPTYHAEIGRYAAEVGVRALWGVGPLSWHTVESFQAARRAPEAKQMSAKQQFTVGGHLETVREIEPLLSALLPGDVILFKASRGVRLEIMVEGLRAAVDGDRGTTEGEGQPSNTQELRPDD